MSNASESIAGYRLTDHTRITELGTWFDAITPSGRRAGALRFDSGVVGLPGMRERVVATVVADRPLTQNGLTGLVQVADVVAAGEEVWLLTAGPASPSLGDLMAARAVDPPGAAAVLVETAQTLQALHASGLAHGALHPGTVVIGDDGSAVLIERGLADAIRGLRAEPDRDVAAWASLARALGADCPAPSAQLLDRAAATATLHGLAAARDVLLGQREVLPGGQITRDRLAQEVRNRTTLEIGVNPIPDRDEGEIVTLLHVPAVEQQHFGPGVSSSIGTTAERIWREGRAGAAGTPGKRRGRVARARRRRTILAAAVFAVIVAGALLAWFRLSGPSTPLAVTSVDVTAPKKAQGCDADVLISGKIVTNGSSGEIVYEWTQSDRKEKIRQTQRITSDKSSYTVPLKWKVSGKSTAKLTATLTVVSPQRLQDKASFTYKC
ncbi:hypothetical protein ACIBKY_31570 [Nonomuraea sp. NPDC050394]|uniref:hypothetical protein n=1 Tax=Nonomuraea sp. NPDC050394 TaxID=3364363 RepID=UPI0037AAB217